MGDYDDYSMNLPSSGDTIAGVCHARGSNSELPPQWLMYVRVENSKISADKVVELGGKIIQGPRDLLRYTRPRWGGVSNLFLTFRSPRDTHPDARHSERRCAQEDWTLY
ncbi:MAG: hypothetical protein ACJAQ6_000016 [Arenicella sp.]|jgi:hypothetical protein